MQIRLMLSRDNHYHMPTAEIDPYDASEGVFECLGCGTRTRAESHPGTCPECDDTVRNIAISRE